MSNYNEGVGKAEHHKILHMLTTKLMDEGESPYSTVLEFIEEFDLIEDSEPTGNKEYSNDYFVEVEYVFKITNTIGISFWWAETTPHDETIMDNWEFNETLVKLVRPVEVIKTEWQPINID